MTEPASRRDAVSCHVCGEALGTINGGDRSAKERGQASRVVTTRLDVRVFVDLAMTRIELLCPHCGQVGRILRTDRIRGVILELQNDLTHHARIKSN